MEEANLVIMRLIYNIEVYLAFQDFYEGILQEHI